MNFDGIIFDVDGTLWDSTEICALGFNRAIDRLLGKDYPRTNADQLKTLFGKTTAGIGAGLFPDRSPQEQVDFTLECIREEMVCLREEAPLPYPGIPEAVRELSKRYPLFIVSNCEQGYIELFMESSGLTSYFTDHLSLGDTGHVKKDNIEEIIRRNHLKNAVYIGDVQGDADSAHGAGIPIIYAAYGFGKIKDAEYTIQSPLELLDIL